MRIVKIADDYLQFDNGMYLYSEHEQDDSERHWADFTVMRNYNLNSVTGKTINIFDIEFSEEIWKCVQPVKDMGFMLIAKDQSKYFVPCYASNNGYYNDSLSLHLTEFADRKITQAMSIRDCQQPTGDSL